MYLTFNSEQINKINQNATTMKNTVLMKRHLPILATLVLLATGCSIYHPQAVSIPLVNQRGDAQVDISAGLSSWVLPDVFTLNATGSYGINDWLAGQAHVNYGFENAYGHLAAGIYSRLGTYGVFEGYLGFGYGGSWRDITSVESDDTDDQNAGVRNYKYHGHFMLPFLQSNIGWRGLAKGHLDIAFGIKAGAYMPDFDYRSYDADGNPVDSRSMIYNTTNILVEPQAQLRVGSQHVKWNFRVGFVWMNDINRADINLTYDWFTVSTGLTFSF